MGSHLGFDREVNWNLVDISLENVRQKYSAFPTEVPSVLSLK
jgi:hypothetical protein